MSNLWESYFDNPAPGLSAQELDDLEQKSGVTLPKSLRDLWGAVGRGVFRLGLFIDQNDIYYDLHELISAKPTDLHQGFVADYQLLVKQRRLIPENLVPFAVESGGDFYAVDRSDESVWYADMELTEKGVLPPPKRLADSLDAFLKGLQEDEDDGDDDDDDDDDDDEDE